MATTPINSAYHIGGNILPFNNADIDDVSAGLLLYPPFRKIVENYMDPDTVRGISVEISREGQLTLSFYSDPAHPIRIEVRPAHHDPIYGPIYQAALFLIGDTREKPNFPPAIAKNKREATHTPPPPDYTPHTGLENRSISAQNQGNDVAVLQTMVKTFKEFGATQKAEAEAHRKAAETQAKEHRKAIEALAQNIHCYSHQRDPETTSNPPLHKGTFVETESPTGEETPEKSKHAKQMGTGTDDTYTTYENLPTYDFSRPYDPTRLSPSAPPLDTTSNSPENESKYNNLNNNSNIYNNGEELDSDNQLRVNKQLEEQQSQFQSQLQTILQQHTELQNRLNHLQEELLNNTERFNSQIIQERERNNQAINNPQLVDAISVRNFETRLDNMATQNNIQNQQLATDLQTDYTNIINQLNLEFNQEKARNIESVTVLALDLQNTRNRAQTHANNLENRLNELTTLEARLQTSEQTGLQVNQELNHQLQQNQNQNNLRQQELTAEINEIRQLLTQSQNANQQLQQNLLGHQNSITNLQSQIQQQNQQIQTLENTTNRLDTTVRDNANLHGAQLQRIAQRVGNLVRLIATLQRRLRNIEQSNRRLRNNQAVRPLQGISRPNPQLQNYIGPTDQIREAIRPSPQNEDKHTPSSNGNGGIPAPYWVFRNMSNHPRNRRPNSGPIYQPASSSSNSSNPFQLARPTPYTNLSKGNGPNLARFVQKGLSFLKGKL